MCLCHAIIAGMKSPQGSAVPNDYLRNLPLAEQLLSEEDDEE